MSGQVTLNKVIHRVVLNKSSLRVTAPLSIHMSVWNQPKKNSCNINRICHCPQRQPSLTTCACFRGSVPMPPSIASISHVVHSWISVAAEKFFDLGRRVKPCVATCPDNHACKNPSFKALFTVGWDCETLALLDTQHEVPAPPALPLSHFKETKILQDLGSAPALLKTEIKACWRQGEPKMACKMQVTTIHRMDEVTQCNATAAKIPPEEQTHKPPDMGLSV